MQKWRIVTTISDKNTLWLSVRFKCIIQLHDLVSLLISLCFQFPHLQNKDNNDINLIKYLGQYLAQRTYSKILAATTISTATTIIVSYHCSVLIPPYHEYRHISFYQKNVQHSPCPFTIQLSQVLQISRDIWMMKFYGGFRSKSIRSNTLIW